jgi:hypothetical protein
MVNHALPFKGFHGISRANKGECIRTRVGSSRSRGGMVRPGAKKPQVTASTHKCAIRTRQKTRRSACQSKTYALSTSSPQHSSRHEWENNTAGWCRCASEIRNTPSLRIPPHHPGVSTAALESGQSFYFRTCKKSQNACTLSRFSEHVF